MVHGVLNHTEGRQFDEADATVSLSRETLDAFMLQQITLEEAMENDDVKISGEQDALSEMMSCLDDFEFWFNIVTP